MSRLKFLLISCMAVLGVTAVAAASASANAPTWKVSGAVLGTGATHNLTGKTKKVGGPRLLIPEVGAEIACKTSKASGKIVGNAAANGAGTDKEVTVTYEECEVVGFPTCTVSSNPSKVPGTIVTKALKSELVWLTAAGSTEVGDLLQGEASSTFVNLWFEGTGCPLPTKANVPVTGSVVGMVSPNAGAPEVITGMLTFPNPAITSYWKGGATRTAGTAGLKVGGHAATYVDEQEVTLEKSPSWGIVAH